MVDAAGTGAAALIGEAAIPGAGAGVADVGAAPAEEARLMLHLLHLLEITQAANPQPPVDALDAHQTHQAV